MLDPQQRGTSERRSRNRAPGGEDEGLTGLGRVAPQIHDPGEHLQVIHAIRLPSFIWFDVNFVAVPGDVDISRDGREDDL